MNSLDKIKFLEALIKQRLTPLITRDYWLLETPHYNNVGDMLIFQGELDFLSSIPHKCLGRCSFDSLHIPKIHKGDLVLFQGGGNFGDLYREPHECRKRIMASQPDAEYIILPQSTWYNSATALRQDVDFFSKYDCTIYARDCGSLEFLRQHFKNKSELLPDMAFCANLSTFQTNVQTAAREILVLKRLDNEFKANDALNKILESPNATITDWPAMSAYTWKERMMCFLRDHQLIFWPVYETFMYYIYRPYLIASGIQLLKPFKEIHTTRLHTCIMSILLGKENIYFYDNSYGKNKNLYKTWLSDLGTVNFV